MATEYAAVALTVLMTIAVSLPLGWYLARVFTGRPTFLDRVLAPIERACLVVAGVDRTATGDWRAYARGLLFSNAALFVVCYPIVRWQQHLPLNPDGIAGMEPALAFHTVAAFVTNTDLQHYSGETGLSTLSQILMVTMLQFATAATGLAVGMAIVRSLAASRSGNIGNFYVDVTRAGVRVLLPLAVVVALVLVCEGVPMTFDGSAQAVTVEGRSQSIARGAVAGVVAIKQIGTNGGGYFGPNSAHPFENPTPLTNLVETVSIASLPMAVIWAVGWITSRHRFALMLFASVLALYIPMTVIAVAAETPPGYASPVAGIDRTTGSMEGKEVRHGAALSGLWAATTTATSNGSVNAMHDSLTPLAGLVAFAGMWLNTVFGGVGVGFINLLVFVVITAFVGGMMIGRTPELLGKKVESREMQLAGLALLWHPLAILAGTAIACYVWATSPDAGTALGWLKNPGPHGFSEIAYEFTSAAANNGSGFEGLGDNTPFWNISTALVMLLSRYIPIIAPLALAARLAAKPSAPGTAGSLPADGLMFGLTLVGVTVVLGLLMFMPMAVLGPIAEQLASR